MEHCGDSNFEDRCLLSITRLEIVKKIAVQVVSINLPPSLCFVSVPEEEF